MTRQPSAEERRSRRREEIVDTAAGLFADKGYTATGIAEIGSAVGLARGALYYYIGSKESLLVEIHDRVMDPLLREGRAVAGLSLDPATRLRLLSEVLLRQIIERPKHCWVFLHEYRSITGTDREAFRAKRAAFESLVTDLLVAGMESNEFTISDVNFTLLAFLGMHNYTYQWAHTVDVDVQSLSTVYCDIFLRGIANDDVVKNSAHELQVAKKYFTEAIKA